MWGIVGKTKSFKNVKPSENFAKRTGNICLPFFNTLRNIGYKNRARAER